MTAKSNTMHPPTHDRDFSHVLKEHWQVSPQRNPAFRTSVWARIDAARRSPTTWSAWLRLNFLRVASTAAACVVIAGFAGAWLARTEAIKTREHLVQRYLASIDPHQRIEASTAATPR